jgi:hypothetical protein
VQTTTTAQGVRYDENGWRIDVLDSGDGVTIEIVSTGTGAFTFSSGVNVDHLAALIVAARADALDRDINWEGV